MQQELLEELDHVIHGQLTTVSVWMKAPGGASKVTGGAAAAAAVGMGWMRLTLER